MKNIKNLKNIKGKRILVRVDFNVPIQNGKVEDNFRIQKGIPTIKYLLNKGAKVTILAHLGKDGTDDMSPVIKEFFKLSKISKKDVDFYPNIRSFAGEEKNDPVFAKELAKLGDIYVNDAFSVSHRAHASVVGIAKILPSYAGLQLEEEVRNLSVAIKNPKHPFIFILGGAKFSTKMPLIKKYLKLADVVFVGGALANDFLKAKGYEVGKSLVDGEEYGIEKILKNKKLVGPVDVVVQKGKEFISKDVAEVEADETIIDIGSESVKILSDFIKKSKLILWNGPLGKYETGGGSTKKVLKVVAGSKAKSIIGGGDTVAIVSKMKKEGKREMFSFVSTGGGATLDFLSSGTLPGIKALQ